VFSHGKEDIAKNFFRLGACLFPDVGWAALRVRG
jgi:hypothetical protein